MERCALRRWEERPTLRLPLHGVGLCPRLRENALLLFRQDSPLVEVVNLNVCQPFPVRAELAFKYVPSF